jgi:hypothetical protein
MQRDNDINRPSGVETGRRKLHILLNRTIEASRELSIDRFGEPVRREERAG